MDDNAQVRYLNTNKDIVSLECGQLDPERAKDMLFIGSETNLLVYDVDNNADVFDQEVADGLSSISFGMMEGF